MSGDAVDKKIGRSGEETTRGGGAVEVEMNEGVLVMNRIGGG